MRAKFDTRVGDLLFRRGQSALVVMRGERVIDWVDWPKGKRGSGWTGKLIPRTQEEMNQAIEDWFEWIERQL